VVVYNSSGTTFTNTGLASSTDYDYKFYSENNGYYSEGVTASATTASAASDYFQSKATGNWSTVGTWQSSNDGGDYVDATVVPDGSAASIFISAGKSVTLSGDVTVSQLIVQDGGVFDMGSYVIGEVVGNGSITVADGATVISAHTNGLNGNDQTTKAHNYSYSANYVFNGTSAQVTGTYFPGANNLTINNAAGVTLSSSVQVIGTLTLSSGVFIIGAKSLTISGAISTTGGSLTGGATSDLIISGSGALFTLPAVSGGLNDLFINRSNGFGLGSDVSIAGTLTVDNSYLFDAGTYVVSGTGAFWLKIMQL